MLLLIGSYIYIKQLLSIAIQYISESTMAAANSVEVGTAQYDFTGSAPDELSFVKGDKIQVTEVISDEWLRGKLNGREGMFPRTFVQLSQQTGMDLVGEGLSKQLGMGWGC